MGPGEGKGTLWVGAKSYNPKKTTGSEGACLERVRRRGTKPKGVNGIRYPGNLGCKQCLLGVTVTTCDSCAKGKPLNKPPGEYSRKTET